MQQAALDARGIDATYQRFDVAARELVQFFQAVRDAHPWVGGLNVTVPHKLATLDLVDHVDALAAAAGAVNTVIVNAGPRLSGTNTDVAGFAASWRDLGVEIGGATVVILGAGGAARAAVVAALQAGAGEIRVANRTPARAMQMFDEVLSQWRGRLPHQSVRGLDGATELLAGARLVVQATSCGLDPQDPSPVSLAQASPDLVVHETLYGAQPTRLLRQAYDRQLRAADGRSLLVYQGAASFQAWTQESAPLDVLRRAVGLQSPPPA